MAWQEGERRQQLFFQCMIQPKPGGHYKTTGYQWIVLRWLAKGEESHSKVEQARAFKVTAREGNGNRGQEELPRHSSCWSVPTDRQHVFRKKLKSCVARACVFPPPLLIPLSAVMCTFDNYISLESCDSGISGTRVHMCQWKPSTQVCSNWSDFRSALGKHRLEKVIERTTSQALVETLLFFLYVRKDFSPPSCLRLQPLLPFPSITLCQCLTLLGDIDVKVMTWFCLSWQPVRNATLGGMYFRGI